MLSRLFTATRLQTFTYLLAVCPFSIAFLVFINSSVSFVVTDLIGRRDGEGDAVGTLGFADELLALVACPLWGLVSDQVGVRHVCAAGYAIIAAALVLFVQARNVYPQLLLGRLLFSLGGSAVSTMVTAVLPAVTATTATGVEAGGYRTSMSSELTITPNRFVNRDDAVSSKVSASPSARLAGFVGTFAGCGALVSLGLFLPLPARFQRIGLSPAEAIQFSYYVVAAIALLVSVACFFGLRGLSGEENKTWNSLFAGRESARHADNRDEASCNREPGGPVTYPAQLITAFMAGIQNRDIALGYIGGFVARASSVGISLFIPLFVNHYFRASGLCDRDTHEKPDGGLGDIKRSCPKAYILASILTGVSQLVALVAAPAFGILSDRSPRFHAPLLFAAVAGIAGYMGFALLPSPQYRGPDGNAGVFLIMTLIGISQIGAIVCSLAVLSNGILSISITDGDGDGRNSGETIEGEANEGQALLRDHSVRSPSGRRTPQPLSRIKGSIAGVYSLWGGAGILLLTKLGGLLFDVASPAAPFYFMAGFNALLLLAGITLGFFDLCRSKARSADA